MIGERHSSSLGKRVVTGDDIVTAVAKVVPTVEVVAGLREFALQAGPPGRTWRAQRIERKRFVRRVGSAQRDVKLYSDLAVGDGQHETALVEARAGKRGDGPSCGLACIFPERIDGRHQFVPPPVDERRRDGRREEIGDARGMPGPEVDDAAPRGVPRRASADRHVNVILKREIRPMYVDNLKIGGCLCRRVLGAVFLGS